MDFKIILTQSELLCMKKFSIESPVGFSVDIEFSEESNCVNTKFHKMTMVDINYDQRSKIAFESDIFCNGFTHDITEIKKIVIYGG